MERVYVDFKKEVLHYSKYSKKEKNVIVETKMGIDWSDSDLDRC